VDERHERRHRVVSAEMIDAYGTIMQLLVRLPLPSDIPSLRGSLYSDEIETGLLRAYLALKDLPMDGEAKQFLCQVIGDWMTAVEWMFRDEEEEAGWHLDLVQTQLSRVLAAVDLVEAALPSIPGRE
jgi:hypothetical protein